MLLRLLGIRASRGLLRVSRSRSMTGYDRNGHFEQGYWEEVFPPILEEQASKAGNAGQESILTNDFLEASTEYCMERGEVFDMEEYALYLYDRLGDSKYNAISIIIEECANELILAWDDSYGGDGSGNKMFMSRRYNEDSVYGSMSNAFDVYKGAAAARGIKLGDNPFK
jgi:hypothetical protein